MSKWIVIEGDNGTGKDVLAKKLEAINFQIINYEPSVKSIEAEIHKKKIKNKMELFLDYNETCSHYRCNKDCISLRYWPSTIAAGFADNRLSYIEFEKYIESCLLKFRKADAFIYLTCTYSERVNRIKKRLIDMPELAGKDNIAKKRGERHFEAMTRISAYHSNWFNIDTTHLTIDEVYQKFMRVFKEINK